MVWETARLEYWQNLKPSGTNGSQFSEPYSIYSIEIVAKNLLLNKIVLLRDLPKISP